MKTKKQFIFVLYIISIISITSCNKEDNPLTPTPAPIPTPITPPTPSKTFLNLTFNKTNSYFSTDGSMNSPVDSNQAKTITSKIDITYIFNFDYIEPGFFDPIARSQVWYWNEYYKPWLNTAVETRYYTTTLTIFDFDEAQADQSKISTYFSDSNTLLAPHGIFPTGSCIGGRRSHNPLSITLTDEPVFAFKNTTSGKRGLLRIRSDQAEIWPFPFDSNTKVDIIIEN